MRHPATEFGDAARGETSVESTAVAGLCRHLREKFANKEMPTSEAEALLTGPFKDFRAVQDVVQDLRIPPRRREALKKLKKVEYDQTVREFIK